MEHSTVVEKDPHVGLENLKSQRFSSLGMSKDNAYLHFHFVFIIFLI